MAWSKTPVKAESKCGCSFSFPLQQMVVLGPALGFAGAGKKFKTSSKLSERQNVYKGIFLFKEFDFVLLLLVEVLQVVYLTGVKLSFMLLM